MTSLSRGSNRVCQNCQTRFFDLRKSPIICPKCGTELIIPVSFRTKAFDAKHAAAKASADDLTEVELVGDDVVDDLMEDASELDDGSDVVPSNGNGDSESDEDSV